jgi:F-type H+/Na+-transporting ATPase subunit alpha
VRDIDAALRTASRAIDTALLTATPRVLVSEEGRVVRSGDGVLRIAGLPSASLDEVILLDGGRSAAIVLGLEPHHVEAISLDDRHGVREGSKARGTGKVASIPVGDEMLGRVVDPLGRPLDGRPLRRGTLEPMPLDRKAPPIHARAAVRAPLHTGLLVLDSMLPIGRGQRELVLGDEGTGKTSLALDVMLRQRTTDVVCVYADVGRRRAETWAIVESLRKAGGRWVVVSAPADASPGMRYLAPYAATTIAERFTYRGEHALVVYDDLSSHAVAWRELSLLLRRSPGRDAYPGDVFYLHARLLERAAQLSPQLGGGSLTALPLARLEGGRLAAYIPTNLISITDGQIVLSQSAFASGQKPAVDVTLSVSRIGSKAQPQALRELVAPMRLDYAAFLELESFSRMGLRVEEATQRRLDVGRRIRLLLRAPKEQPLPLFDEIVRLVLAGERERLVRVPEDALPELVAELVIAARAREPAEAAAIERTGQLMSEARRELTRFVRAHVAARFGGGDE